MGNAVETATLRSEIVGMLFASTQRSLLSALFVMMALLFALHHLIEEPILVCWSMLFLLAYGLRFLLTLSYKNDPQRQKNALYWLHRFRLSTAFCGLIWGLAGILLSPVQHSEHQALLNFALVGVCGAGVVIYSIDVVSSYLFCGCILLLKVPYCLWQGTHVSLTMALLFILFVVFLNMAGRSLAQSLHENINLRITSMRDNRKVHQLAYFDFLTGLPNRRLLSERLQQAFLRCQRQHSHGAVFTLDLNNFKGLNDSRGHLAGDELLQQVANRLQQCLRKKDTVARMGGDEFVALLDDLGSDKEAATQAVLATADKLMEVFKQPFELQNGRYQTGPSMGICLFYGNSLDEQEVLRRADIAMYEAKQSNAHTGMQLYDEALHPEVERRATLQNELAFALQSQQLLLHYQPQFDATQQVIGAEVLLRWHHPLLGMVPPDQFIPIAEKSSVIVSIGYWVLQQACAQLQRWQQQPGMATLTLSVNVSAVQFMQPDFVEQVISIITVSGCRARQLRLELTESILVKNIEEVVAKINTLRALGVRFSLDDFGVGQSSLSLLRRFPLDELKIDKSFIRDILHNKFDSFIVQMIIQMAHNLGHSIIAEGVEMPQQKALLQEMGCHVFQGYLFSPPVPLETFEASLHRKRAPADMPTHMHPAYIKVIP